MLYAILGLSIVFFCIGLLVTKNNAADVLTTYSHLSRQEKNQLDLSEEARVFRRFHFFLGISLAVVGTVLHLLCGESASLLFLIFYPLTGFVWYIGRSAFIKRGKGSYGYSTGLIVLVAAFLLVLMILRAGYKENAIRYESGQLEITGAYGERIHATDIAYFQIVDSLPDIRLRTNGFSTGRINKGFFRTKKGETVKLLIDTRQGPYLLIKRNSGEELYIAYQSKPSKQLLEEMHQHFPAIEVK